MNGGFDVETSGGESDAYPLFGSLGEVAHVSGQIIAGVRKDHVGAVCVDNEMSTRTDIGGFVGGMSGSTMFVVFPAVGTFAGDALCGCVVSKGVLEMDKPFVPDVRECLRHCRATESGAGCQATLPC